MTILESSARPVRRPAYAALGWVVVFTAFHVYWFAGGRFGLAGELPDQGFTVFGLVVAVLFVVGAVAPLAAVRSWGRWVPSRLLLGVLWAGFALLVLRGAAGVADDAVRVTGLSSTGLTGLTIEQVTGTAHPSAPELWSGRATDAYFTIGGLLFGATALAYRRTRRPSPPAA